MRKSKIYIFCLMLFVCSICQAQKLSIKPYFLYHQSVSKQIEPVFHNIYYPRPAGTNRIEYIAIPAGSFSEDFTLANGLEYGLTMDYTFSNQLGFELGLGYFSGLSNSFEATTHPFFSCTTDWNYHSIAIRPLFSYAVMKGKSVFIGKTGPTVHYSSATKSAFIREDKWSVCSFANRLNWGYLIGLEYNYQLLKQLSLAIEFGYEQYKYTPHKAMVEYDPIEREKDKIHYVNKVIREPEYSKSPYLTSYSPPLQNKRLKESILFNSIYFGIGLKFNL